MSVEEQRYVERRYTLAEARKELYRQECLATGHRFHIIVGANDKPQAVTCKHCGRHWKVCQ